MSEPPSRAIRQERWEGANLSEKSSNKRIWCAKNIKSAVWLLRTFLLFFNKFNKF